MFFLEIRIIILNDFEVLKEIKRSIFLSMIYCCPKIRIVALRKISKIIYILIVVLYVSVTLYSVTKKGSKLSRCSHSNLY